MKLFILLYFTFILFGAISSFHDGGPPNYEVGPVDSIISTIKRITTPGLALITLRSGATYKGTLNKNIIIDSRNVMIISSDTLPATIDCAGNSRAIEIIDSKVHIVNLVFTNCSSSNGSTILSANSDIRLESVTVKNSLSDFGAIHLSGSKLTVTNSTFASNTASVDGGAIYATDESSVTIDSTTLFRDNKRIVNVNNINQFLPSDVAIRYLSTGSVDRIASKALTATCDDSSKFIDINLDSLCTTDKQVSWPRSNSTLCGDKVCNTATEDFFNCPVDCTTTNFNGFLHTQYTCQMSSSNSSCTVISKSPHMEPTLYPFPHTDGNLKGELETYFKLKKNGKIYLRVISSNVNIKVFVDNTPIIEYQQPDNHFNSFDLFHNYENDQIIEQQKKVVASKYLVSDKVHQITIQYSPSSKHHFGARSLSLEYSLQTPTNFKPIDINFYSFNLCGDGIHSPGELCESDKTGYGTVYSIKEPTKLIKGTCGNGVCDESDPHSCIEDCYQYITETCPPMSVRKGSIVPNEVDDTDALGVLINNQMVWRLPGFQHFTFGYDRVYGQQRSYPIFNFGFCSDKDTNILEDVYRLMFYEVPKELNVVPLPRCTFSVTTKMFSNSSEMRSEMISQSSTSASVSAGGDIGPIKLEAEASYTKEKSFKTSLEMEANIKGTVIESTVNCFIYNVELNPNELKFSLNFLRDIAISSTVDDFLRLIGKYGTHYYKSSILGGSLKQITTISEQDIKEIGSKEVEDHSSKSLSITVSSPKLNVHSKYSDSQSKTTKEDTERKLNEKTSKSSIITYGGAPGSYGPSKGDGPTTFGEWAKTIDMLPIPVNPRLEAIRNIIPRSWKTPDHKPVLSQWMSAENLYYQLNMGATNSITGNDKKNTKMLWFNSEPTGQASMRMRQTLWNGKLKVESVVEFTSIYNQQQSPEHYVDKQFYFNDQYSLVEPQFRVKWIPSKDYTLTLESSAAPITTTKSASVPLEGQPHSDIEVFNNIVFLSTEETDVESNFLFDTKGAKPYPYTKRIPVCLQKDSSHEKIVKGCFEIAIHILHDPKNTLVSEVQLRVILSYTKQLFLDSEIKLTRAITMLHVLNKYALILFVPLVVRLSNDASLVCRGEVSNNVQDCRPLIGTYAASFPGLASHIDRILPVAIAHLTTGLEVLAKAEQDSNIMLSLDDEDAETIQSNAVLPGRQLYSRLGTEELGVRLVKNLIFLSMLFYRCKNVRPLEDNATKDDSTTTTAVVTEEEGGEAQEEESDTFGWGYDEVLKNVKTSIKDSTSRDDDQHEITATTTAGDDTKCYSGHSNVSHTYMTRIFHQDGSTSSQVHFPLDGSHINNDTQRD
eukprot:gene11976-13973_t